MKSNNKPLSKRKDIVVQELDGEVLIYDLSENKAFCLNETSALVWQACDGTKNAAEISQLISEKLKLPANEDLVWFALNQLEGENLIENSDQLPDIFAGMSRREVIKRVGLGTMVALPIVATVIAPSSVFAQSCGSGTVMVGDPCSAPFNCVSCCCAGGTCQPLGGLLAPADICLDACQCAAGPCAPNGMAPRMCN